MLHEGGTSRRARESYAFRARFAWSFDYLRSVMIVADCSPGSVSPLA
jgi:hypothetical protein